jgi:hypothetical protein
MNGLGRGSERLPVCDRETIRMRFAPNLQRPNLHPRPFRIWVIVFINCFSLGRVIEISVLLP